MPAGNFGPRLATRLSASPPVSVVMPAYNGERFLREAVDSVLAQSFSDFELVVVDDGSTDSTPEILADYASSDARVVVRSQPKRGRTAALNCGFALARSPLIARIDADDVAPADRLELQQQFLTGHAAVAVVGGAVAFMDESGRAFAEVEYPLKDAEIRRAFPHATPLAHPAVMLRKEAFERVGGYRPIFVEAEELDLWLRIAEQYQLANLPELAIRYRMHAGQTTVQKLELQTLYSVAARAAARARIAGRPDPFEAAERIDEQTLLSQGVRSEEVTATFVHSATWLAKTMDRAGYTVVAEGLFAEAAGRARSDSGSRALIAFVHRERGRRHAEQGSRLRAKLEMARAALAERAR